MRTWRQYMNRFVTFLDSLGVALTIQTPSSRGGFNRSVTCIFTELLSGSYHALVGHWTRLSSSPWIVIHGITLLGPAECFRVVAFEYRTRVPILSFLAFRNPTSLTRTSAPRCTPESTEPYISFVTTRGYRNGSNKTAQWEQCSV